MIRNCVSVSSVLSRRGISSVDQKFVPTASTRQSLTFGLGDPLRDLNSASTLACSLFQVQFSPSRRKFASNVNGSIGSLNGKSSSQDIINSTAATTEWKRNQYRKITEKFQANIAKKSDHLKQSTVEPLQIDNYEDVQPMWKEMESRVTRRRSLTLEQRGGMSGRRNVRRSDEDVWLEAGVYDGGTEDVEAKKE
ncbi:hypothetical protein HJC23_006533 [Cyclotella cryptica]|uniref:Uncharacterized protein n=1 Tax=Cyclotella cryptica TaxID=29204 RepID=A0ABD3NK80_9STRA